MLSRYNFKIWAVASLVALITILVYLPALQNGFVNWDDPQYIYENPEIKSIDFKSLKWMFTTFDVSNWHPLTWLSHAIDYAIWGLNPMGHHLTNIIFHGLNAFLVVLVVTQLVSVVRRDVPAQIRYQLIAGAVTGLLFGLHPIHVESVAWVSERKDVLCAFFFLLSILSYLEYTSPSLQNPSESPHHPPFTKGRHYILCLLFFIMALMSKPMAVTLPVVLIILDFYPLERLDFKLHRLRPAAKVLIEKLPFFVFSFASSALTILAQKSGGAVGSLEAYPLWVRIRVGIRALGFYITKIIWPADLAPFYPYPAKESVFSFEYTAALLLTGAITLFSVFLWRRQKIFTAIWTYFAVTLFPVSGIIQVGAQSAADRYTYLPGLGPMLLAGIGISWLWEKAGQNNLILKRVCIIIPCLLILTFLSVLTIKQIEIWRDSLTLWNAELRVFPDNANAIAHKGEVFYKSGNFKKAIGYYNKAIEADPYASIGYYDRGITYLMMGNYQQAISDFNKSIELSPVYKQAYYDRMLAYKLAIKEADRAIKLNPGYADAYFNRGFTYELLGDYPQAFKDYNKTIELNPYDVIAYLNRAALYLKSGNHAEAVKDFQAAARLGNKQAQDYLESKGIGWQY
ncbi:MAG TPA: tetratricopeptide repeat protein [Nitrospirae bacterium]|nr:TPR repeat-containing protein YrrB [bacterium BMS3Abin06]HDH10870.1 tetratricopeptide repeat protein [Nitrospirota bacterium]HDZ02265.1 tetratricopeptide repeat protein [Nitrospirota bacterium]